MAYFLLMKKTSPLTAKQVVRILRPAFSPSGSNRRVQEEVVMTKFVEFLGLCEGIFIYVYKYIRSLKESVIFKT